MRLVCFLLEEKATKKCLKCFVFKQYFSFSLFFNTTGWSSIKMKIYKVDTLTFFFFFWDSKAKQNKKARAVGTRSGDGGL